MLLAMSPLRPEQYPAFHAGYCSLLTECFSPRTYRSEKTIQLIRGCKPRMLPVKMTCGYTGIVSGVPAITISNRNVFPIHFSNASLAKKYMRNAEF